MNFRYSSPAGAGLSLAPVFPMSILAVALALGSGAAQAQQTGAAHASAVDESTPSPESDAQGLTLPAITVHARGSDESAKDLPYGLSVISGETLTERRLLSVEQVLRATPGVNINSSGGANVSTIYIRGVGALYPMSMDDSSVAMNVNGSPMSMRNISIGTLDVDQVEILKGPQGTLFGGMGEAGGINLATRQPTRETEGYARVEYGQDKQFLTEAAVGGALTDSLAGRLAIRGSGSDHWIENSRSGAPLSKPRDLAFRGSLLWDITPDTSALVSAERHKMQHLGEQLVLRPYGKPPIVDMDPSLLDDAKKTVERYALELDHRYTGSRLTAITAFTDTYNIAPVVYDARLQNAMGRGSSEFWNVDEARERMLTQDLRLGSLPQSKVFWVTGLSFSKSDRSYDTPRNTYGNASANYRDFTTERYGVYGEATYPLTDALKLTTGLRQSWDRKTYDGQYHGSGQVTGDHRKLDDSFTTGRVALSYALTPNTSLYGTYARGYNPGGFNDYAAQPADSEPYKSAKTDSFELGFKMESADRRYGLNGSVYMNRVHNNHLLSYDSATYVVSVMNADTRSKGAELEGVWRLDNGLAFTAGLSFIDAEIATTVTGIGDGDVMAGNRMPDVSRWSVALGATYRKALPGFLGLSSPVFDARVDYQYVGSRPADPQNHFDLSAYHKVDMRLGIANGRAEYYVWGNNLLDEQPDLYGYFAPPSVAYGAPARGRTLGVGLSYAF
ncbi:TonB-dependent receptor [Pollutimonas bauzanensis]|uniref:Iron complex outermembrane recepter protein n=1 Tax=Pollutimonas bauzanensis TaxID=658167 RepID=A0A1M5LX30_9BURK|nr:TonB-dependent receptor [Pollutimonas bauzanensis]SHG69598.1 iron complex outermembrane recepter protein [Pollutimonas bauzanensis]